MTTRSAENKVVDLMAALEASVAAAKRTREVRRLHPCEFFVVFKADDGENGLRLCGAPSIGTVGVDFTPYCDAHIHEMQWREESST